MDGFNPFQLLDKQTNAQIQQFEQMYTGEEQRTTFKARTTLQSLERQYNIEAQQLERTPFKTDDEFSQKVSALNAKYQLRIEKVRASVAPALSMLQGERTKFMSQVQQQHLVNKTRLEQIELLKQDGTITPQGALQKQLDILGIDLPVGAFTPSPEEEFRQVSNMLRVLKAGEPEYIETMRAMGVEVPEAFKREPWKQQAIQELETRRNQILTQIFPADTSAIRKIGQLKRAGQRAVTGEKGGTIAGLVSQENKELYQRMLNAARTVEAEFTKKPKYQRNAKTGETRVSYDGGKTWQVTG